jgi:hypothetical protein
MTVSSGGIGFNGAKWPKNILIYAFWATIPKFNRSFYPYLQGKSP